MSTFSLWYCNDLDVIVHRKETTKMCKILRKLGESALTEANNENATGVASYLNGISHIHRQGLHMGIHTLKQTGALSLKFYSHCVAFIHTNIYGFLGFNDTTLLLIESKYLCTVRRCDEVPVMKIGYSSGLLEAVYGDTLPSMTNVSVFDGIINIPDISKLTVSVSAFNVGQPVNTSKGIMAYILANLDRVILSAGAVIPIVYKKEKILVKIISFNVMDSEPNPASSSPPTDQNNTTDSSDVLAFERLTLSESDSLEPASISSIENFQYFTPITTVKPHFSLRPNFLINVGRVVCSTTVCDVLSFGEPTLLSELKGFVSQRQFLANFFVSSLALPKKLPFIPRGILLYGTAGCGKTTLARALGRETKANLSEIQISKLWAKADSVGSLISDVYETCVSSAPSIIFIDDIGSLCPKRALEGATNDFERRCLAALLDIMDDAEAKQKAVYFLATANSPDSVSLSLRRCGRLEHEIEIGVPSRAERRAIIEFILRKYYDAVDTSFLDELSSRLHGYVPSDIVALVKYAALQNKDDNRAPGVTDFQKAMKYIQPSAMREIICEMPSVKWVDIGGYHDLRRQLKQSIDWPLYHRDAFDRLGILPPKGILLYGPPGCCKTMVAKAVATESGLNFISIKGPELFSKYVGESEKAVRNLFRRARQAAPAVVFFDELDAIAIQRGSGASSSNVGERVLAQLLTEIDGIESLHEVTLLAATNRPDMIDSALLRPGRLDRLIYVPLPDEASRKEILQVLFRKIPVATDMQLESLVRLTSRYSGAEITAVCQEAALAALEDNMNCQVIEWKHFEIALSKVTPRTEECTVQLFESFNESMKMNSTQ